MQAMRNNPQENRSFGGWWVGAQYTYGLDPRGRIYEESANLAAYAYGAV